MRRIAVHLPPPDRQVVEELRSQGIHSARHVMRAHILAALDQGIADSQIGAGLGISRKVIWRTRSAYQEKGVHYALEDVARPGAPRKYQAGAQALIVALACSRPPRGAKRWTLQLLVQAARQQPGLTTITAESGRQFLKNLLKPWRKALWCGGRITQAYRQRMYGLLDLCARPYNAEEPVVCVDEQRKQLLQQTRAEISAQPGAVAKEDYEYRRAGTRNIFVAVEPNGGHREAAVTARRTKADFVGFVNGLLHGAYAGVKKLHLVLDNLNTHFRSSFEAVLGTGAGPILERIEFHYTPKHASWLNMAAVEIGILEKQCTGRRLGPEAVLAEEVAAWQHRRNLEKRGINWGFTREVPDQKLGRHYVT